MLYWSVFSGTLFYTAVVWIPGRGCFECLCAAFVWSIW